MCVLSSRVPFCRIGILLIVAISTSIYSHGTEFWCMQAARILVVLLCKHEFDARYQKPEDKLYIAQLYFPLVGQVFTHYKILAYV
jgi:hypothetical protein